jgi:hypothetical protein
LAFLPLVQQTRAHHAVICHELAGLPLAAPRPLWLPRRARLLPGRLGHPLVTAPVARGFGLLGPATDAAMGSLLAAALMYVPASHMDPGAPLPQGPDADECFLLRHARLTLHPAQALLAFAFAAAGDDAAIG